ncbi:MAG: hypothetical protein ACLTTH_16730 [Holdemanella porci]
MTIDTFDRNRFKRRYLLVEAHVVNVESCDVNGNITLDKLGYGFYLIDELTNDIQ